MRVIRGKYRGLKLKTITSDDTRPTSDRVKESIFSMIEKYVNGAVVLDLFAGSGALGIEALSSYADKVDFCDKNKEAVKIIKENLSRLNDVSYEIYNLDYKKFLDNNVKKYDLIFLDPPYKLEIINELIRELIENDFVSKKALIVCESSKNEIILDEIEDFCKIKEKIYGTIKVSIFRRMI